METEKKTKLTQEDIEGLISEVLDYRIGNKTTAVVLVLRNGFEVVGTSACVDPANYNHQIGIEYAKKRAMDKVWELAGYALQDKLMVAERVEEMLLHATGDKRAVLEDILEETIWR